MRAASIWLLNESETEIKCTHAIGPQAEKMSGSAIRARKFIAAYRTASGRLTKVDDSLQSKWMDAKEYYHYFGINVRSMISIPLVARGKLMGEMNVINKIGEPTFTRSDRDFIGELSRHIAAAVQNTQLYRATEPQC